MASRPAHRIRKRRPVVRGHKFWLRLKRQSTLIIACGNAFATDGFLQAWADLFSCFSYLLIVFPIPGSSRGLYFLLCFHPPRGFARNRLRSVIVIRHRILSFSSPLCLNSLQRPIVGGLEIPGRLCRKRGKIRNLPRPPR